MVRKPSMDGKARPIYQNIPGAPFKIGERVQFVKPIDDEANMHFIGKTGIVTYFEYSCGCGQSWPDDPMIGVEFRDGTKEEFWKDELVSVGRAK